MTGRDPGLQPERTQLAWRRTTLSFVVAALLAGRQTVNAGTLAVSVVVGTLSLLTSLSFLRIAYHRIRTVSIMMEPRTMSARGALLTAVCPIVLAVFGAVFVR